MAASGGGTERFTVFNDGRLSISGTATGMVQLNVQAPASQSVDIFRVQSSVPATLLAVQNTGKLVANVGAVVAQPGVTSGTVLQVGGTNAGYTGNLQSWVNPSNTIVASINETGQLSAAGLSTAGTVSGGTVTSTGAMNVASTITNSATGIRYRQSQNGSVSFVFSAVSSVDVNVTFPIAFAVTPKVTATLSSLPSNSSAIIIRTSSVTNTGMTLRANDTAGTARTLTITADWIAEE